MIDRWNHPGWKPPVAPFSHVVVDGSYAFLSGLLAADLPGGEAAIGDIRAETRLVMAAIGDLLARLDLSFADLVRVDVHLTDLEEMAEMNAVYAGYFSETALPARTCTESPKLFGGCRVEITAMARLRTPEARPD